MSAKRVVVAVAVLAVVAAFLGYLGSDRLRLDRRLSAFEDLLSKDSAEEQIATWGVARQVVDQFAPTFVVLADPYEGQIGDPRELTAAVHRFRSAAERIEVRFQDRDLTLRSGNRTALITFVATVTMDFGDSRGRESYLVQTQWQEEGGDWLINEVRLVEVLEEDPGLRLW